MLTETLQLQTVIAVHQCNVKQELASFIYLGAPPFAVYCISIATGYHISRTDEIDECIAGSEFLSWVIFADDINTSESQLCSNLTTVKFSELK